MKICHKSCFCGIILLWQAVKSVRLLFMDHERASGITVKGTADLAYVACGGLEAYFERYLNPWNFAGG